MIHAEERNFVMIGGGAEELMSALTTRARHRDGLITLGRSRNHLNLAL